MQAAEKILIVDDEESIVKSLTGILEDEGFTPFSAESGEAALAFLERDQPDLVLLDIWLPGIDGIEVLKRIKEQAPGLQVVMMSGHGTIATAVEATKLGAYDFVEKPLSLDKVILAIGRALEMKRLSEENRRLRESLQEDHQILGRSEVVDRLREQIKMAAPADSWILITGENGTGKEYVARNLHRLSLRADRDFIAVNCAAIPEELIESELFGHEKGAFTGAGEKKLGKFELAHRGTLFLDEIADMSLKTQSKILRILQERQFERVGGNETINVDVRVVAATNKNLEELITQNQFRDDLYYRLNVIPIRVPPLRERLEDMPIMVAHFADQLAHTSTTSRKSFSPEALEALSAYSWPGNVRELRNLVERLVIMSPGPQIQLEDIPEEYRAGARTPVRQAFSSANLKDAREEFEREFIAMKLEEHGGNISRTAQVIGISREALHRRIESLGLRQKKS